MFYHFCVDICTLGLRTWHCKRFAPFPGSKARSNKFYIWRQCTYVVYVGSVRVIAKWKKKTGQKLIINVKKKNFFVKKLIASYLKSKGADTQLLFIVEKNRHNVASKLFQRWDYAMCLLGSGQRPNLCIYLFSCVHGLHIINGSKSFTLSQMIRYVRTTWYDLLVLSQHEGDNRIHTICSKSVL